MMALTAGEQEHLGSFGYALLSRSRRAGDQQYGSGERENDSG